MGGGDEAVGETRRPWRERGAEPSVARGIFAPRRRQRTSTYVTRCEVPQHQARHGHAGTWASYVPVKPPSLMVCTGWLGAMLPSVLLRWLTDPLAARDAPMLCLMALPQKVAEKVVRELVGVGLRADGQRGEPSLGMRLSAADKKALRQAARRRVDLTAWLSCRTAGGAGAPHEGGEKEQEEQEEEGTRDGRPSAAHRVVGGPPNGGNFREVSPEEALFARVKAEVVNEDKVRYRLRPWGM